MGCPFFHKRVSSFWEKIKGFFSEAYGAFNLFSAQNLHAILDTTVDSIVTIDEKSTILSFNATAEKMFGYQKEEVIGKKVTILMPEPFHSQHDTYVENYLRTGIKRVIGIGREVIARRKNGTVFPIDLAVSEVVVGSKRLFTGIIRDITARKQSEVALQQNTQLGAELKAKEEKDEYIAILSHALRTPLTSIYGTLELLVAEQNVSKKVRELISIAHRNSKRLLTLVNEVLDVEKHRVEEITFQKSPVSVDGIIEKAITELQSIAEALDVQVIHEPLSSETFIFSDRSRVVQVLMNLIHNAIKFSCVQGKVIISTKIIENRIRISVSDQGRGIPEEFQSQIFSSFLHIPANHTRIAGGSGFGLYICKKIMDRLGGTIGFTTKINEGSTFYIELPIYTENA